MREIEYGASVRVSYISSDIFTRETQIGLCLEKNSKIEGHFPFSETPLPWSEGITEIGRQVIADVSFNPDRSELMEILELKAMSIPNGSIPTINLFD